MYGHPALVVEHARALAPSLRAFNRWFWKDAKQGVFPELASPTRLPPNNVCVGQAGSPFLPSPAPSAKLMEQVGGFYPKVAVSSTTATNSHKWEF